MVQKIIEELIPGQEELIYVYREKWRSIALSTERIDRYKAKAAIEDAYALLGLSKPEILFYDSPYAVAKDKILLINIDENQIYGEEFTVKLLDFGNNYNKIVSQLNDLVKKRLRDDFIYLGDEGLSDMLSLIMNYIYDRIWNELEEFQNREMSKFWQELAEQLNIPIPKRTQQSWHELYDVTYKKSKPPLLVDLYNKLTKLEDEEQKLEIIFGNDDIYIEPHYWIGEASFSDFCINVLNCECDLKEWEILESIATNCGCIFPLEKLVIICDRPCVLNFDDRQCLHAEGKPAVEFTDGYKIYCDRGVCLPD